jgi:hypothetical protein
MTKEVSYKVDLGQGAHLIGRKWKDDVEVAIFDSDDYAVYLNFEQWGMMLKHWEFVANGLIELKTKKTEKKKA